MKLCLALALTLAVTAAVSAQEKMERVGIKVDVDPKTYPNGRFALLHDPEGNPIQLWQPQKNKS